MNESGSALGFDDQNNKFNIYGETISGTDSAPTIELYDLSYDNIIGIGTVLTKPATPYRVACSYGNGGTFTSGWATNMSNANI